ncbi:unnamed protein product [Penicillium nalgiovense]|nr:unnamed protein product [Penicillium nalgiovense]CAG8889838.1 unnamed protein product [Penicillium salamii]
MLYISPKPQFVLQDCLQKSDDRTGNLHSGRPTGYHSSGFQAIKGNHVPTRADTWLATHSQREAKPSPF